MSTTVTYKGETLTTVNNATKVLETEGTYLEDDITLVDVTGGGSATLGEKSVTANGVYNASSDNLDGYSKVTVSVPASAVDTGTKNINTNGTHDVIGYASAYVQVPTGGNTLTVAYTESGGVFTFTNSYADMKTAVTGNYTIDFTLFGDEAIGAVYSNGYYTNVTIDGTTFSECVRFYLQSADSKIYVVTYGYSGGNLTQKSSVSYLIPSGTKSITANGNNQDVVGYAAVNVNVPNSYSAGDEGKVVSSGALVAQTAHADVTPTTSDQTIDTTLNNSLKVKGDANLVAGNIKKDVTIFGTTGTYEGSGGGGGSTYSGTFTPASRQGVYEFYAPGCTYLACGLTAPADLTTGVGFVYAFFCYAGHYYASRSTNSGSGAAGDANASSSPSVTYTNDTFAVDWGSVGNTSKVPQVGSTYTWVAW